MNRPDDTRPDPPQRDDAGPVTSAEQLARKAPPEVLSDEEKGRLAEEASRTEDA